MEERNAPKTAEVRKSEDDPEERTGADGHVAAARLPEAVAVTGQPSLTYDRTSAEPFAVYRLQKGEALYSSVAIRFTGRVYAKDVGDVLDRIVKFNGIDDVARIPIGYRVKIPMSLLLPEYLPADDPTRVASEEAKRESAKLAVRPRAKGLAGVRVILDAGHGGRDVGATHDDVWESNYVYDVMCRLKRILEKKIGRDGRGDDEVEAGRLRRSRRRRAGRSDGSHRPHLAEVRHRRSGRRRESALVPGQLDLPPRHEGERARRRKWSSSPFTPTRCIRRCAARWPTSPASAT